MNEFDQRLSERVRGVFPEDAEFQASVDEAQRTLEAKMEEIDSPKHRRALEWEFDALIGATN